MTCAQWIKYLPLIALWVLAGYDNYVPEQLHLFYSTLGNYNSFPIAEKNAFWSIISRDLQALGNLCLCSGGYRLFFAMTRWMRYLPLVALWVFAGYDRNVPQQLVALYFTIGTYSSFALNEQKAFWWVMSRDLECLGELCLCSGGYILFFLLLDLSIQRSDRARRLAYFGIRGPTSRI